MRLLVTGGAGFIGANFVHATVRERPDVQVSVLDSLTYAGSRESLAPVADQVRLIEGDVTDAALMDKLVEPCDGVVHFAAGGVDGSRPGRGGPGRSVPSVLRPSIDAALQHLHQLLHHRRPLPWRRGVALPHRARNTWNAEQSTSKTCCASALQRLLHRALPLLRCL